MCKVKRLDKLRKILKRIDINKELFDNAFAKARGTIFAVVSTLLAFFSLDSFGIKTVYHKILFILEMFVVAVIYAIVLVCNYKKKRILNEPSQTITLQYGNLWDFAFPKRSKNQRIIVVNVNTTFDTVIDPPGVDKPLVSEGTIHGQWIKQMENRGIEIDKIDSEIEKSLQIQRAVPSSVLSNKTRGKCNNYPKGTIAWCTYKDTIFYLLALSEFDESNNAHNSFEELRETIETLIDFIDKNGQGIDVYMPLMGTGLSRTKSIDSEIALELLKSELIINKDKLHGSVNVVVYERYRDKIPLGVRQFGAYSLVR